MPTSPGLPWGSREFLNIPCFEGTSCRVEYCSFIHSRLTEMRRLSKTSVLQGFFQLEWKSTKLFLFTILYRGPVANMLSNHGLWKPRSCVNSSLNQFRRHSREGILKEELDSKIDDCFRRALSFLLVCSWIDFTGILLFSRRHLLAHLARSHEHAYFPSFQRACLLEKRTFHAK